MVERRRSDVTDGVSWWCSRCKGRKSIREGSFFSKSRLTLQKWMLLIYMWAREYPVKDAAEEAEVQEKTAIDVYQWLREVCSTRLIADRRVILGGHGPIIESLFHHKPKVVNMMAFTISWINSSSFSLLVYILPTNTLEDQPHPGAAPAA